MNAHIHDWHNLDLESWGMHTIDVRQTCECGTFRVKRYNREPTI